MNKILSKTITIVTFLLIFVNGIAQKNAKSFETVIEMKDGSTKSGTMKFPIKLEDKELKLGDEEIETAKIKKVTFTTATGEIEYHNLFVYNYNGKKIKEKKKLLRLIIPGKVNLYFGETSVTMQVNSAMGLSNFSNGSTLYYFMKENEPAATFIHENWNQTFKNGDFKTNASRYFAENPKILAKIKDKTYTYENIYQLVMEYNFSN